jgi:hypothetical protein
MPARYDERMPGAGFAVTWDARCDTRHGGSLTHADKACANRRNRRHLRRDLRTNGERAALEPKLWTGWDVI